jgi:hypothetical protein
LTEEERDHCYAESFQLIEQLQASGQRELRTPGRATAEMPGDTGTSRAQGRVLATCRRFLRQISPETQLRQAPRKGKMAVAMFIKIENGGDQEPEESDLTEVERRENEEILVDAYDEYEQAGAWDVACEDGIEVPFSASLLGIDVKVTKFRVNDQNIVQCRIARGDRKRWIGVDDLDNEGLPVDFVHIRSLYRAWSSGRD